ncbi:hypothetical protein [Bacillus infantis]|uniref:hypothetical protein n=1 Tax=Bacillus infantis TaxID=324767 RepID=UPI003CF5BD63
MELNLKLNQIVPKEEIPKSYSGKPEFEFDRKNINDLLENYERDFEELISATEIEAKMESVPFAHLPKSNELGEKILSLYETFSGQTVGFPKYESFVEVLLTNPLNAEFEAQFYSFINPIIDMTKFVDNDLVKLTINGETFDKYTLKEIKDVLLKYVRDKELNFELENVKGKLFEYLSKSNLSFEKGGQPYNHYLGEGVW